MAKEKIDILFKAIERMIPAIEKYRATNYNKYVKEMERDDSAYEKSERYKHRVRVVDIILPELQTMVEEWKGKQLYDRETDEIE